MANAAERYADELVGQTIRVTRFGEGVRSNVLAILSDLEDDIESQIRRARLGDPGKPTERLKRLESLRERVQSTIADSTKRGAKYLRGELVDLAQTTAHNFNRMSERVFSSDIMHVEWTPGVFPRLVDGTLIHGNPASVWWSKQTTDLQTRFQQQVRLGILQGEPVDAIVKRVRGESAVRIVNVDGVARKVKTWSGGIMSASAREAGALVRTSVQAVANRVMLDSYEDNADIIKALAAVVTLDNITSDICIARDGGVWYLDTKKATPESKVRDDFPGPPPWHFNCRTVLAPITFSWEELIERTSKRKKLKGRLLDSVPDGARASMDGQVPGSTTYEQWLRGKSVEKQVEVLGKGKWELWKDKSITLTQLIDQSGRPLTLAQLKIAAEPVSATAALAIELGKATSIQQINDVLRTHPALSDALLQVEEGTDLEQWREVAHAIVRNFQALGPELVERGFGQGYRDQGFGPKFAPLSVRVLPGKEEFANATWYKGGIVNFNSKYMSNPALYREAANASDSTRGLALHATPGTTLSHEFGHVFDFLVDGGDTVRMPSVLDGSGRLQEIWGREVRGWLKKTLELDYEASAELPGSGRVGVELSKYARTDGYELFAEAWSVIVEKPKAQWPGIVQELAGQIRKAFAEAELPVPQILR